jgi:hypothetical protein
MSIRSTAAIWRRASRDDAFTLSASEAEQIDGIGPWMNAAGARAEIVPRLQGHRLNAPREGRGANEQVDVRRPHRTLDDRFVTGVTKQIA